MQNWVRWCYPRKLKWFYNISGVLCLFLVALSSQKGTCKQCFKVWGDSVPLKKSRIAGNGLNLYRWVLAYFKLSLDGYKCWKSLTAGKMRDNNFCFLSLKRLLPVFDGGWSNHPEQSHWDGRRPKTRLVLPEQSDYWREAADLLLLWDWLMDQCLPDVAKADGGQREPLQGNDKRAGRVPGPWELVLVLTGLL